MILISYFLCSLMICFVEYFFFIPLHLHLICLFVYLFIFIHKSILKYLRFFFLSLSLFLPVSLALDIIYSVHVKVILDSECGWISLFVCLVGYMRCCAALRSVAIQSFYFVIVFNKMFCARGERGREIKKKKWTD